jgi:predicted nucleic acid-binding protein
MKRVLLDTNVVLDALLDRQPWSAAATQIWQAHRAGKVEAHVNATSVTNIFYVSRKLIGRERAWQGVHACLDQLRIIAVDVALLQAAVAIGGGDLEDNLQITCATAAKLEAIVTRDPAGFAHSPIEVLTPAQLLQRLTATTGPSADAQEHRQ